MSINNARGRPPALKHPPAGRLESCPRCCHPPALQPHEEPRRCPRRTPTQAHPQPIFPHRCCSSSEDARNTRVFRHGGDAATVSRVRPGRPAGSWDEMAAQGSGGLRGAPAARRPWGRPCSGPAAARGGAAERGADNQAPGCLGNQILARNSESFPGHFQHGVWSGEALDWGGG